MYSIEKKRECVTLINNTEIEKVEREMEEDGDSSKKGGSSMKK